MSIKLQECFGLAESPVYCGQRVQFHLLSPAGRPLAVTDDLASFWAGPYQGVRADMRGRYPKHPGLKTRGQHLLPHGRKTACDLAPLLHGEVNAHHHDEGEQGVANQLGAAA